ncbi:MAG TPA: hypothetical protein VNC41_06710, partial [Acidimicrobiia bacterium]|nr:hypothetical protein [Acidimicrobiia bacterium]
IGRAVMVPLRILGRGIAMVVGAIFWIVWAALRAAGRIVRGIGRFLLTVLIGLFYIGLAALRLAGIIVRAIGRAIWTVIGPPTRFARRTGRTARHGARRAWFTGRRFGRAVRAEMPWRRGSR